MSQNVAEHNPIFAIAASPDFANNGVCFAARRSGLDRSTSAGVTWESAYASLNLHADLPTTAVAFSPDFASDHTVFAGVQGAILRSVDAGKTWQVHSLPTPPPLISVLAVSPCFAEDGLALAGTLEDGVFISRDRGVHWQASNFGLLDLSVLAIEFSSSFASDDTIYIGSSSGIFHSRNAGRAWREADFPPDSSAIISLAHLPGALLAGTQEDGLYRSSDEGRTWHPSTIDKGSVDAILYTVNSSNQVSRLVSLVDGRLEFSTDEGATWTRRALKLERPATCITLTREGTFLVGDEFGNVVCIMFGDKIKVER